MQDRFRFRAYNPLTKKMDFDIQNTYDSELNCFGHYFTHEIYNEDGDLTDHKWIVMQCTGLRDKNDKLIYEGDIIRHPNYCNGRFEGEFISKVQWSIYAGDDYYHNQHQGFCTCFPNINSLIDIADRSEVIGNIYENLELVDSK